MFFGARKYIWQTILPISREFRRVYKSVLTLLASNRNWAALCWPGESRGGGERGGAVRHGPGLWRGASVWLPRTRLLAWLLPWKPLLASWARHESVERQETETREGAACPPWSEHQREQLWGPALRTYWQLAQVLENGVKSLTGIVRTRYKIQHENCCL